MLKKFFLSFIICLGLLGFLLFFSAKTAHAAVWPPPSVIDIDPYDPCQAYCQAQRLVDDLNAQDLLLGFPPDHWFIVGNADGTFTVVCVNGQTSLTFRSTPPPPSPIPTPTTIPACNVSCVTDSYCATAPQGCTKCLPSSTNPAVRTCQPAPTATPIPTATPVPPTPTATPIPPSPTPTPRPFNPNACTCDGMEYDTLQPGQQVTVTSYAKVTGEETEYARVVSQTFKFLSSPNDSSLESTIVMPFVTIPSTLSTNTPGLTRFKSSWTFTMPQLDSGRTYRIMTQLDCQPKTTTMASSQVMGTQDQSLFERFINFLGRVVGVKPKTTASSAPSTTPQPQKRVLGTNLQIGTFTPVEVYLKACDIIRFRVGG